MLKFRRLLEARDLGRAIFDRVNVLLAERGLKLTGGTMVDATIIHAASSTKNEEKSRDPEMHQTRKSKQWYFVRCAHLATRDRRKRRPAAALQPGGMKLHIGADAKSGLIHSAMSTAANVHDSQVLPDLLHGAERRVYGDSAYRGQKAAIIEAAPNAKDFTHERVQRNAPLTDAQKAKSRYRGLAKNANRLIAMCALYNVRHAGIVLSG